jgi:hypothetical protein
MQCSSITTKRTVIVSSLVDSTSIVADVAKKRERLVADNSMLAIVEHFVVQLKLPWVEENVILEPACFRGDNTKGPWGFEFWT